MNARDRAWLDEIERDLVERLGPDYDREAAEELVRDLQLDKAWYDETHRRAVARIRRTFEDAPRHDPSFRFRLRGLVTVHDRRVWNSEGSRVPWGWRRRRVPDRDAIELMPLWLYCLVELPWALFPLLKRLGLWDVREEGGLWVEGHVTAPRWLREIVWCFLHDRDHYERPLRPSRYPWRVKNIIESKHARRQLIDVTPYWGDESQYDFRVKLPPPKVTPW